VESYLPSDISNQQRCHCRFFRFLVCFFAVFFAHVASFSNLTVLGMLDGVAPSFAICPITSFLRCPFSTRPPFDPTAIQQAHRSIAESTHFHAWRTQGVGPRPTNKTPGLATLHSCHRIG
jgi:hypothetical protein